MNKNSNTYIIIYSIVMVVIVAVVLAYTSISLKDRQTANAENEMKGAILMSVGEGLEADNAANKTAYINEQYERYIVSNFVVNAEGQVVENADAFSILSDLKAEYDKPEAERQLPIFVSENDEGNTRYILPLRGKGLWGPIWGYLALESDWDTIYGVVFDHKGETPGLGAEITTTSFRGQFEGKRIFNEDDLVGIVVLKGSGVSTGNDHAVDAISGGTITSRGVGDMLKDNLEGYRKYIESQRAGNRVEVENLPTENDVVNEGEVESETLEQIEYQNSDMQTNNNDQKEENNE